MMRKTRLLAIAAIAILPLFLATACGSSPTTPTPPVEEPPVEEPPPPPPTPPTLTVTRILAFGDSLTEGGSDGLPLSPWGGVSGHFVKSTTYPYKLQEMLDEIYTSQTITVTNGGKGGERPIGSEAIARLITELDDHNPQVLLLMHGVNSLNREYGNGNDDAVEDTADAVDELIETAKSRKPGIRIMLATIPRQKAGASDKVVASHLVVPFNNEIKLLADEEGATLVDIYKVISESMLTLDGLHITEAGNLKMAETFYAAIKACCHREPE